MQGESTLASISQPADEFTFGHTGHMAIILGRLATLIPSFLTNLVMVMLLVGFFFQTANICLSGMMENRPSLAYLRTSKKRPKAVSVPPRGISFESRAIKNIV